MAKTVSNKSKTKTQAVSSRRGAAKSSRPTPTDKTAAKPVKPKTTQTPPLGQRQNIFYRIRSHFRHLRRKYQTFRGPKANPHRSFRRSYREDYVRETNAPGLLSHAMTTFQLIFKCWKTFLPLIVVMTFAYILLVGLLNEDVYLQFQETIDETSAELAAGDNGNIGNFAKAGLLLISTITTGGLDTGMSEVQVVFMLLLFLIMWLVTIYLLRHFMAGGRPKLRDGLYNALSPLISTLLVFVVIFIQAVPLMLVLITASAAKNTGFLDTPFYALIYFIFAALMVTITVYLLSSSLIALVAVTAPGVYPMRALFSASDLMAGRRTKFIVRVLYLLLVVVLVYVIIITPIILLDLLLKSVWDWLYGVPIVPFCLLVVTCFVFIYATAYLYRYYRYLLDYQEK